MKQLFNNENTICNIYRTPKYIVKQNLFMTECSECNSILISEDVYYARNKKIDKKFNRRFENSNFPNGKRVHSTVYTRKYYR